MLYHAKVLPDYKIGESLISVPLAVHQSFLYTLSGCFIRQTCTIHYTTHVINPNYEADNVQIWLRLF